ncbi:ribonuclease H-like domain-containing protein [Silvanigrella aquatica]|uniref:Predicted 3'-5' exonuclease PolB-like domain-containing protein n=1 Tax=Silvanigrella aquatica TaxID=1915309 RepID=A0A1L4D3H4_9BACT|nr:ribonuclease H-like domain-containing protein [Silvanigrella aquatica]APJ04731.1 hypothetical protein AXG55_12825 [Silvanigrella aquatica]
MVVNPSSTVLKAERPQAPILIFDIETVPDIPLLYLNYQDNLNLIENFDEKIHWNDYSFYEAFKKQTEIEFPKTLYHCVLSICAIYVDPETYIIMDGFKRTIPKVSSYNEFRSYEKKILEEFWQFSIKHQDYNKFWYDHTMGNRYLSDYQKSKLKKLPVTFCGYNITNFDLMVIEQRSLINFITCPIEDYVKNLGNDSYRYKYASDKVFDLMNFVSNYDNKNARIGLDILAKSMGLGGKMSGMDGSRVAEEYFQNHASVKIEEYCAVDVLISYGVLLAVQKFRGILSEDQFKECLIWFEQWLLKEGKPLNYHELARESANFFNYAKKT